jgi:Domain of unknown function (DUF3883)
MRIAVAGVQLDAEVDIGMVDGRATLTMHSGSGSSGGRAPRNPDYGEALRVILARLAERQGRITDALVTSSDALRAWPDPADRRLVRGLRYPVLVTEHDPGELRRTLGEAMRTTARDSSLGHGGNNRRRVTFWIEVPGDPPLDELASHLVYGEHGHGLTSVFENHQDTIRLAVPLTVGPPSERKSRAQGYVADAAYRRAVEMRAMQMAREHYEQEWDVVDTSRDHPYDFRLTRAGEIRYVEVKGTAGTGESINLTANEVDHADRHPGQVELFVVSNINVDRSDPANPIATGGAPAIVDPLRLGDGELKPIAFSWRLPPATRRSNGA